LSWCTYANQTPRLGEACSIEARDACPQLPDPSTGYICLLNLETFGRAEAHLNAPFDAGLVSVVMLSA